MHALSIHTNRGTATTTRPDKPAAVAALHAYLTRADVYLYPAAERPRVTGSATIADLSHPPTPARKRPS